MTQWTQLGPRERDLLAVLRRADDPLTARDLLDRVRDRGDDVAYSTVKRTADRLVEKELVERDSERHRGATRHRYRFDAEAARRRLIPEFVREIRAVLGDPAVERLGVRTARDTDGIGDTTDTTDSIGDTTDTTDSIGDTTDTTDSIGDTTDTTDSIGDTTDTTDTD